MTQPHISQIIICRSTGTLSLLKKVGSSHWYSWHLLHLKLLHTFNCCVSQMRLASDYLSHTVINTSCKVEPAKKTSLRASECTEVLLLIVLEILSGDYQGQVCLSCISYYIKTAQTCSAWQANCTKSNLALKELQSQDWQRGVLTAVHSVLTDMAPI